MAALNGDNSGGAPAILGAGADGSIGVVGMCDTAYGVSGVSTTTGEGVHGSSTSGYGVHGTSQGSDGVHGETTSQSSFGVSGVNNSAWPCTAIEGLSNAGHGIRGINGSASGLTPTAGCGVWGDSDQGFGVFGSSKSANPGVYGTSQGNDGVHGETSSESNCGVHGITGSASGLTPTTGCGVWGDSDRGFGVYGSSKSANAGVYGSSQGSDGVRGETTSQSSFGVSGVNNSAWPCTAIEGSSNAGHGIRWINGSASGLTPTAGCGVWGDSDQGIGVYGSSKSGAAGVFDGNVSVTGKITASDVFLAGADCAEDFDVSNAGELEPGTVVVFDGEGCISQSTLPYSKRVAGVISGAGEYRPGVVLGRQGSSSEGKAPVALAGRVYCKVDASHSPIEVGDMLTTSPTPGFAMKASDPLMAFGAVIGKAMAPVRAGRDLIPILVTLQ
jgi:hypothetical protein